MLNNLVINNIKIPLTEGPVNKKTKDTELFGTGDTSKVENAYKTYFRKYIDGEVKVFGGTPLKRANITLIGPPAGSSIDDQKKTEMIYAEAEQLLQAYIKEVFGENETYFSQIASRASDIQELVNSKKLLLKVSTNITKKLAKLQQSKIDKQSTGIVAVS